MMLRRLLHTTPVFCLLLAACNAPTVATPNVTQAELDAESQWQDQAARTNPFPPIVEPVRATKAMKVRLGKIAERIAPEASRLCMQMRGIRVGEPCTFGLVIKEQKGVNAYADGKNVVVTAAMMEFARNDTHLALVVAHEMAHNIMEHPQGLGTNVLLGTLLGTAADIAAATQGADTQGLFGSIGVQATTLAYSPGFEREADYIALYILARANFPIEEAPMFWRNFSQFDPQGIYARGTHPSNPERFIAMNKAIVEIRAKQRQRLPLFPSLYSKNS